MRFPLALTVLAGLMTTTTVAEAQGYSGCWTGSVGAGATLRRAILDIAAGRDGMAGSVHVMNSALATDSLAAIESSDSSLAFGLARGAGRRFEGTVFSGRFTGRVRADTSSQPFTFERAAPGGDPALALTGYWRGGLYQADAMVFRMGLKFSPAPCGQVMLTLDSPDQNSENLPITALRMTGDSLVFEMSYIGAAFRGTVAPGSTALAGEWTQGAARVPMRLVRSDSAATFARPQDPVPPFPYTTEDVTYHNASDSTRLAGTITLPPGEGPFPAAVLITGSGPQDRNETLMGHRPFLVLADHLTRHGIAVLRSDDRGVGGSSGNVFAATIADNAGDVAAAVALLRRHPKVDPARVGLIGHSEGGWVAPLVASRDDRVAFVVLLAGPAVTGEEILLAQSRAMAEASGTPLPRIDGSEAIQRKVYAIVKSEPDSARAITALRAMTDTVLRTLPPDQRAALDSAWRQPGSAAERVQMFGIAVTPWFRHLLTYDPVPVLGASRMPVMALFGERDLQVPPSQSVPVLERLWATHPDATIEVIPRLNHLFQHAATGLVAEYATIEETFATPALDLMTAWILRRVGGR